MKKWIDVLNHFGATGNLGKCPNCNLPELHIGIVPLSPSVGYGAIWCNSCKHAIHLSRVLIKGDTMTINGLPDGLIFDE